MSDPDECNQLHALAGWAAAAILLRRSLNMTPHQDFKAWYPNGIPKGLPLLFPNTTAHGGVKVLRVLKHFQ